MVIVKNNFWKIENSLVWINKTQFYIQLVTAAIFFYIAMLDDPISLPKVSISILLLLSWSLGYIRHRIQRRRIRSNWKSTKQIQKIKQVTIDKQRYNR